MPVSYLNNIFLCVRLYLLILEYSKSGYILPFPEEPKDLRKRALKMWTPPSTERLLDKSRLQTLPAHTEKVFEAAGVPKKTFWDMWEVCHGCDSIILGTKLKNHVCDLTTDD